MKGRVRSMLKGIRKMDVDSPLHQRLHSRLREIYGSAGEAWLTPLLDLLERYSDLRQESVAPVQSAPVQSAPESRWDQRDVVLITYGDQVQSDGATPLRALGQFLVDYNLHSLFNTVHILPFYPYTSDDGFSVVDYQVVDPCLGSWEDVERIRQNGDLMFDLVLNHVSQKSPWFQGYLAGDDRYLDYFIEVDPAVDLSAVTRPRNLPLLTAFETSRGRRHLWTTFSEDQVDLNLANPAVLMELLDTLLFYIRHGARFIRLDAIAYLWKQVGTNCIHLSRTHAVVKLMRDVVELLDRGVVLLTETNVPHEENVSYFGEGDESHMVYQFSLPPLMLDALLQHDSSYFNRWLEGLEDSPVGATFFNFTASHDGIGVRPLEGLVPKDRLSQLLAATTARGGVVATKQNPDGTESPYELNITFLDILDDGPASDTQVHVRRFLASQAIMLSLRGIPGVYFHSLVGTPNDTESYRDSGIPRRINRRKFQRNELDRLLHDEKSSQSAVFEAYRRLLEVRIQQKAFHPDGPQQVCQTTDKSVVVFLRTSPDQQQRILVAGNVTDQCQQMDLSQWGPVKYVRDLLTGAALVDQEITLEPYQVAWLEATTSESI